MNLSRLLIATSLGLATTGAATAQIARFEWLDQSFSASDLSPDGRYVVGTHSGGGGYLWSREGGYTTIGGISATAVSDDGSVILGSIDDGVNPQSVAAIWTEQDGWLSLGTLENPADSCGSSSSPYELSADGTVAVGLGWQDGCDAHGFRWTAEDGMVAMESLANGGNRASVVSADGSLLGGFAQGATNRTPAIWTAGGMGQLLDPPDGVVNGEVYGMSDDGTILLGEWDFKPFLLEEGEEIEVFNGVIEAWAGAALDIADDGTIVGFDRFSLSRLAWIRPNGGATVNLLLYLQELGVTDLPSNMDVATAISTNGNIIIGHNTFANGWMVNLCVPDISGDGQVSVTDLVAVIVAWGTDDTAADVNLDGVVDVSDLVAVITGWGPCP